MADNEALEEHRPKPRRRLRSAWQTFSGRWTFRLPFVVCLFILISPFSMFLMFIFVFHVPMFHLFSLVFSGTPPKHNCAPAAAARHGIRTPLHRRNLSRTASNARHARHGHGTRLLSCTYVFSQARGQVQSVEFAQKRDGAHRFVVSRLTQFFFWSKTEIIVFLPTIGDGTFLASALLLSRQKFSTIHLSHFGRLILCFYELCNCFVAFLC